MPRHRWSTLFVRNTAAGQPSRQREKDLDKKIQIARKMLWNESWAPKPVNLAPVLYR